MYLSSALAEVKPMPITPFEEFDPYKSLYGPCITIPVTDAIRRQDDLKKKLVGPSDWEKFKLTLSENNLRMARTQPVGPGRIQETTHYVLTGWKRYGKDCACGEKMGWAAKTCIACNKAMRKMEAEKRRSA